MFEKFDGLLKNQIWIGFFIHLNWALFIPLCDKLKGELWTASIIAIAYVAMNAAKFSVKLFQGMSLRNSYLGNNVASLLAIGTMLVYLSGYPEWFLVLDAALGILFCIFGTVHTINFRVYLSKNYSEEVFKEYMVVKEMRTSLGNIIGFSLVAIVYAEMDIEQSMKLCVVATALVLVLKQYNWWKYFRNMK